MPSVNPVTFRGFNNTGSGAERYVLECVANMQDKDILRSSIKYAKKESDKTFKRKFCDAAVPLTQLLAPACFAVATKGSLAKKAAVFSAGMLGISALSTLMKRVNVGVGRLEDKHPKLKESNEKHPYVNSLIICAGTIVAGALLLKTGLKLISKKMPPSVSEFLSVQKQMAANKFNNLKILSPLKEINDKLARNDKLSTKVAMASLVGVPLAWNAAVLGTEYKTDRDMFKNAATKANNLASLREHARNMLGDSFSHSDK